MTTPHDQIAVSMPTILALLLLTTDQLLATAAGWEGTWVCEQDEHKAFEKYKEWKATGKK
jgi:hypothetical protein